MMEDNKSNNSKSDNIENTVLPPSPTPEKKKRNKGIFYFKHFPVYQDLAGIGQKVGTDALLVAGYTSIAKHKQSNQLEENRNSPNNKLNNLVWNETIPYDYQFGKSNQLINNDLPNDNWPNYILDIGTGTNVLSLMMGQRFKDATINSIDIDEMAIKQASFNIDHLYLEEKVQVSKNIYLFHTPIQDFVPGTTKTVELKKNVITNDNKSTGSTPTDGFYDLIISAPPYFPSDPNTDPVVSSMLTTRRIARHTHTLSMQDLVLAVKRLLRPNTGLFTTIVSVPDPANELEQMAQKHGLVCVEQVDVTDSPGTKLIRKMYTFKLAINTDDSNNNNNNNNNNNSSTQIETIKQNFTIYETTIKESTQRHHRKHSDQYKWLLNDFCNHFHKELDNQ
ncbi:hypothetical protein CYY_002408 [Polysphondylium violaceum]|uniref:Methyltransferase small domain-containing protein n=1 Tax=Polysphondylium violaceum TaxID=133409 RepID=A0A8J4PWM4_9MYCE|nr:hypothetical protein CYY_002408 [Polysphondylium violaceum]